MKHNGRITISRWQSRDGDGISIELTDDSSRIQVFRVEMTPEAFGNAITGLGFQECTFEMGDTSLVGMKREHKIEIVPIRGYSHSDADRMLAVEAFEVDGWKASLSDIGNHHRKTSKPEGYSVNFHRYVKPE